MKTIKEYLEDTEETLNIQFPKGKCKERGNALVLFAIFNMAMENYRKDILKLIPVYFLCFVIGMIVGVVMTIVYIKG